MKVEFPKKFSRDIDVIKTKSVKQSVIRIIEVMEIADRFLLRRKCRKSVNVRRPSGVTYFKTPRGRRAMAAS